MSVLTPLVDRLAPEPEKLRPLDIAYGRKLTDAEHASLIGGRGFPRPLTPLRLVEPSPVLEGRIGVSDEAVRLFDLAQAEAEKPRADVAPRRRWWRRRSVEPAGRRVLRLEESIAFAGGTVSSVLFAAGTRIEDLHRLVDELVAFGLVERVTIAPASRGDRRPREGIRVAPAHELTLLASNGWGRWT